MKQNNKCMSCFGFEKKQGCKARKDQKCAKNNDTESHFRYYIYCLKKEICSGILKGKWWWMWQLSSDGSGGEWQSCRRELRSQTSFSCSLCQQAWCYTEQKFHIHRASYLLSLPALPWGSRHEKLKHRTSEKNWELHSLPNFIFQKYCLWCCIANRGVCSVQHSWRNLLPSPNQSSCIFAIYLNIDSKNHHQTIIPLTEIEFKTQALIKFYLPDQYKNSWSNEEHKAFGAHWFHEEFLLWGVHNKKQLPQYQSKLQEKRPGEVPSCCVGRSPRSNQLWPPPTFPDFWISEGKCTGLAVLVMAHNPAFKNADRTMKTCGNSTMQLDSNS